MILDDGKQNNSKYHHDESISYISLAP